MSNIDRLLEKFDSNSNELATLRCQLLQLDNIASINPPTLSTSSSIKGKIKGLFSKIFWKAIKPYLEAYFGKQTMVNREVISFIEKEFQCRNDLLSNLEEIVLEWDSFSDEERSILRERIANEAKHKRKTNKVIQIVSTVNYGDAVGNDVLAIQRALKEEGYPTAVFTGIIHSRIPSGQVFLLDSLPKLTEDDIVIYHVASDDPFVSIVRELPAKVVLRYHNITPPEFFEPYDTRVSNINKMGLEHLKEMQDFVDYGMVDSEFNKQDLIRYGFKCPIEVAPILIPFADYEQTPSQNIIDRYRDDWTNVAFVGRVAPNKKFEDVILAFKEYKEKYNPKSRLLLVGNYSETDAYYLKLKNLVEEEKIEDIVFTGHISFADILAYYRVADLFLCMSEHEGFCVPIVEAQFFNVPIIAYNSCAVPNTMGDGGILLSDKNPKTVAAEMNRLMKDETLQKELIAKGEAQIAKLQYEVVKQQIISYIEEYSKKKE